MQVSLFAACAGADWRLYGKEHRIARGERRKNYYPMESVGIACGLLISALHLSGLVTLTHTPSPMGFLSSIFQRPKNEKPFLLLVVGYPAENCRVPDISRKGLAGICSRVGRS